MNLSVAILSKEYPPHVYGGAGVHVEYLSRALAGLDGVSVEVRCMGDQRAEDGRLRVRGFEGAAGLRGSAPLFALSSSLAMLEGLAPGAIVHTHTWYTAMAGFLARRALGSPHVLTVHSLEPLRPWKRAQLGEGGYELSTWMERTAIESADRVIAVSDETRKDVLRCCPGVREERVAVIHNGIDPDEYHPRRDPEVLRRYGVDPARPYVLFVGRITEQKGADHFVEAAARMESGAQVVVLAGASDTPEFWERVAGRARSLRGSRPGVHWIQAMVPRGDVVAFYSQAAAYCCPSVYEPFGIVNIEAMACEAPVVASRTGGIPEIVVDGETGFLVPPADPAALARSMDSLVRDEALARRMGRAGRARVLARFTWRSVAEKTAALYRELRSER